MTVGEWGKLVGEYNEKIAEYLEPDFINIYTDSHYGCIFEDKLTQVSINFYRNTQTITLEICEGIDKGGPIRFYTPLVEEKYSIEEINKFFQKIKAIKIKNQLKNVFN